MVVGLSDAASVSGEVKQGKAALVAKLLENKLKYPRKSSVFRSAVEVESRLDTLLKGLGLASIVFTVYSEGSDVITSYREMEKARNSE